MAKRKTTTKKDLEAKIAQLEAKLASISSQAGGKAETKAPPPPPKPSAKAPPKKAEAKAAPPATIAQALENAWQNYPAGNNTHYYKEHTTGFSPGPNRYYARRVATIGRAPTQDWNIQKAKVTGFTACSNQYYATRARMAPHPADKSFTGYGLVVEGAEAQAQQAPPPPPPPKPEPAPEPQPQQTSARTGGSKKSDLEAYERDYMARLDQEARDNAELMKAAAELAAKRRGESGGSSGQAGSTKGSLPKGS
ncbi:MAG: trans-sialidase [Nitrosopumilaceae archaeon]